MSLEIDPSLLKHPLFPYEEKEKPEAHTGEIETVLATVKPDSVAPKQWHTLPFRTEWEIQYFGLEKDPAAYLLRSFVKTFHGLNGNLSFLDWQEPLEKWMVENKTFWPLATKAGVDVRSDKQGPPYHYSLFYILQQFIELYDNKHKYFARIPTLSKDGVTVSYFQYFWMVYNCEMNLYNFKYEGKVKLSEAPIPKDYKDSDYGNGSTPSANVHPYEPPLMTPEQMAKEEKVRGKKREQLFINPFTEQEVLDHMKQYDYDSIRIDSGELYDNDKAVKSTLFNNNELREIMNNRKDAFERAMRDAVKLDLNGRVYIGLKKMQIVTSLRAKFRNYYTTLTNYTNADGIQSEFVFVLANTKIIINMQPFFEYLTPEYDESNVSLIIDGFVRYLAIYFPNPYKEAFLTDKQIDPDTRVYFTNIYLTYLQQE